MSYLLEIVKAVLKGFRSPRETVKSVFGVSLYRNTIFLLVQSAIQALSGFVFWIIATKIYTPEEVGIGSALVSAMLLLAFIGTLGMGIGIIRFLPDAGDRNRLLNSTFSVCVIAALAFAITFTGGLQLWSPRLAFLQGNAVFFCLFVFFVITSSFSTTLIQVFIGFRRSDYSFFYSLITLVRLALLLPFARLWGAFGILAAWGAGEAIALSTCLLFILPRLSRGYRPVPYIQGSILTKMLGFTSANYVAEIFRGIPGWILPLMAVNILGAESNAFFYQSWNVAGIALSVAVMTSLSLFAEGSQPDGKLSRHLKNSVRITLVLLVPLVLIIGLLGDKILLILGREYSAGGTKLLWLLAPAAIPTSINQLYMGIVRVEKKLKQILLITGAIAVSTLGLSWILMGRLGIVGIGVAWLTSQTAVMLVLLPAFMRRMRNQTVEKKVRDT